MSRLMMLAFLLTTVPSAAQGPAPLTNWANFVGLWRVTSTSTTKNAASIPPIVQNIRIAGGDLTFERRDLASGATETSRYRLDGQSARTVRDGGPVDATAAIEGTMLVIRTRPVTAAGERPTVTESYTVGRNTMMMDRTITIGGKTTISDEILQRIPDDYPLHGGTEFR